MHNTFNILNEHGLDKFKGFLLDDDNKKKYIADIQIPKYLITDTRYCDDTNIDFNISNFQNIDICEIGKRLTPLIENNFKSLDFDKLWSSLSLHLSDIIFPMEYDGQKQKLMEKFRYIIDFNISMQGSNLYKHFLYSAYLCHKNFGENSKYFFDNNTKHSGYADKILGRKESLRYSKQFSVIKKLYIDTKAQAGSKKPGNLSDFMKIYIRQISINYSLYVISEEDFYQKIPDIYKQHAEKYGKSK